MWIKRNVVMLPTNEKSKLYLSHFGGKKLHYNNTPDNKEIDYQHLYILSDEEIKESDWFINTYINKIYNASTLKPTNDCKKIIATTDKSLIIENCIVESLYHPKPYFKELPKIHQSFIEHFVSEYNKDNIITEVMVEYINNEELRNWYHENGMHNAGSETNIINELKINPKDNTISICKVKNSWNKEEVISLINKFGVALGNEIHTVYFPDKKMISINDTDKNKWIEKNLYKGEFETMKDIILRFKNHANIHGYPSKSFKEKVNKWIEENL